jgi:transcriptional regulator with XRE-family HTH domain
MTDSLGARLRQGRELRGLTLQQASESTKLRAHYIQALENDDYTAIPSAAQARGFLRIYAEFLELDLLDLVAPTAPVAAAPDVDSTPALEAPASQAGRSTLWNNLLGRFVRRANKEALPPSVPNEPLPEATAEQAAQGAAVPAGTEAKTVRHRKGVAAGETDGASGTGEVKKNAGR